MEVLYAIRYRGCYKGDGHPDASDKEVGRIHWWPMSRILEEINSDRPSGWADYDETDWTDGLDEWTWYEPMLDKDGKPKTTKIEVTKMRLMKFDNAEETVRKYGNDKAKEEFAWLLKLARTNFAACYGAGTQGSDTHDAAICALNSRLPRMTGGGRLIEQVCKWLYAEAQEKCLCGAPAFITGCEHALSSGDEGADICVCKSEECPWIHHVGVFV